MLSRREQIRSQRPTPVAAPSPDLFRPEKPAAIAEAQPGKELSATVADEPTAQEKEPPTEKTTTSRLLDAKRRAQKRADRK